MVVSGIGSTPNNKEEHTLPPKPIAEPQKVKLRIILCTKYDIL